MEDTGEDFVPLLGTDLLKYFWDIKVEVVKEIHLLNKEGFSHTYKRQ